MNRSILLLKLKRLLFPGLALLNAVCAMGGAQTNCLPALAPFELRDQYNCPHRIFFPAAGVTLLTVADRKGSEQIDGWIGPLKEHYGGRIAIEGIADMSAVPCLLRSMVREQFKKCRAYPVMLDWEGPGGAPLQLSQGPSESVRRRSGRARRLPGCGRRDGRRPENGVRRHRWRALEMFPVSCPGAARGIIRASAQATRV